MKALAKLISQVEYVRFEHGLDKLVSWRKFAPRDYTDSRVKLDARDCTGSRLEFKPRDYTDSLGGAV